VNNGINPLSFNTSDNWNQQMTEKHLEIESSTDMFADKYALLLFPNRRRRRP
jgi:hypothetical protein